MIRPHLCSRLGNVWPRQQSFTQQVQVVDQKGFTAVVLDPNEEAFVAYVASLQYRRS